MVLADATDSTEPEVRVRVTAKAEMEKTQVTYGEANTEAESRDREGYREGESGDREGDSEDRQGESGDRGAEREGENEILDCSTGEIKHLVRESKGRSFFLNFIHT